MKWISNQSGQSTITFAFGIFIIFGMAGFAADTGVLFRDKRVLQTAADAAAIAAAAEARYGDDNAAALAMAARNGVTDGSNGYTVTETVVSTGYKVVASQAAPTYFMKIFHISSIDVSATAIASNGPASGCIYALDPSGIDVGMTGSGNLSVPDCGIIINSASSNALNVTGSGTISAYAIGIVGGYRLTGSGSISPTPVTGIAPAPDPLAWLSAPSFSSSSCLPDPHITGSTGGSIGPSISGGTVCYNGVSITGSGPVTMTPGTYVINGAMSMTGSGSLTGSGVTIYLAPPSGSLSLTGSGALTISAPTSGTYNGILFYEDRSDSSAMKITGSSSSILQGIFYAPDAALTVTGSSGSTMDADLVVHALSITGSGDFGNYASTNPNEPLTSPRLVQ